MIKTLIGIVFFVFAATINSLAQPILSLSEPELNLGTIDEAHGKVFHSFSILNSGKDTLVISEISASCSCTSIQKYDNNLPPGVMGKFAIEFNPKNMNGKFGKTITIKSNSQNGDQEIKIIGTVIQANTAYDYSGPFFQYGNLKFSSPKLSFDTIPDSKVAVDSILIVNVWNKSIKIEIDPYTGNAKFLMSVTEIAPNGFAYLVIKYNPTQKTEYGDFTERVQLNTNDSLMQKKQISIRGYIKEDFSLLSEIEKKNAPVLLIESVVFDFGEITQGKTVETSFLIENKGKSNLIFRKIKPACGCTSLNSEIKELKPGEKYTLKFKFSSQGKSGVQDKTIELITNDPKNPVKKLHIKGTIGQ